jgi:hypothetical protein
MCIKVASLCTFNKIEVLIIAKEFEVVVVGGESGVRIRESCKGRHRSILLDRSELAWLLRTFESLVCVEDSRVFWDQSRYGFPRIIAQRHFNRHGGFICLFWCIWRERNLRCFENLESSLEEVLELFLHTLYVWSMAYLYPLSISFAEFLTSFSLSS